MRWMVDMTAGRLWGGVALAILLFLAGCAGRTWVAPYLGPEGAIYRESEQEDWGARTTLKMRGAEF
jgi:hypothetical protein